MLCGGLCIGIVFVEQGVQTDKVGIAKVRRGNLILSKEREHVLWEVLSPNIGVNGSWGILNVWGMVG